MLRQAAIRCRRLNRICVRSYDYVACQAPVTLMLCSPLVFRIFLLKHCGLHPLCHFQTCVHVCGTLNITEINTNPFVMNPNTSLLRSKIASLSATIPCSYHRDHRWSYLAVPCLPQAFSFPRTIMQLCAIWSLCDAGSCLHFNFFYAAAALQGNQLQRALLLLRIHHKVLTALS